jgi:hypothetical protein
MSSTGEHLNNDIIYCECGSTDLELDEMENLYICQVCGSDAYANNEGQHSIRTAAGIWYEPWRQHRKDRGD